MNRGRFSLVSRGECSAAKATELIYYVAFNDKGGRRRSRSLTDTVMRFGYECLREALYLRLVAVFGDRITITEEGLKVLSGKEDRSFPQQSPQWDFTRKMHNN